jgi:hypothetical protein
MSLNPAAAAQIFRDIAKRRRAHALQDVELPAEAKRNYKDLSLRAEDLITSARSAVSGLPPIHFGFVLHSEVNAFATREQGHYFIGVHTGMVFLLRLLIGRMLSDASLFPGIGSPSEERADLPVIRFYVPHADQMWSSEELALPRNEVRRHYAHFIMDRALMFFVGHEIAHISQGHVDYWQQEYGRSVYSEGSDESLTEAMLIERQCLELDADRRSVMTSVNSIRDTQSSAGFGGLPWSGGPGDTASLFHDWSVAIAIVFRLLGDQRISDINPKKAYPPLLSRWQYAEALARCGIDLFWPAEEREAARSSIVAGRHDVIRAFATIIGNALQEAPEQPPADHLKMLHDYWNEVLVQKVRPYSYEF